MRSTLPGPVARAMGSIERMRETVGITGKWPATARELSDARAQIGFIQGVKGEKPSARIARRESNAQLRAFRAARIQGRFAK
jgi:hypothetical protein